MPRVARIVPDDPETKAMLRAQAQKAEKLYRRAAVKYPQCRSTVFVPSKFALHYQMRKNCRTILDLSSCMDIQAKRRFKNVNPTTVHAHKWRMILLHRQRL